MNHLKTIGLLLGGILVFLMLIGASMACFGDDSTFSKVSLGAFIGALLTRAYIDIYKWITKK